MVSTDGRTDRRTDTEGYNIIPRHTLVAGYKKTSAIKSPTLKSKEAHADAFEHICQYIEETIITDQKVERLSMIRERYLKYIMEHHPEDYNVNYRSFKLKDKLWY